MGRILIFSLLLVISVSCSSSSKSASLAACVSGNGHACPNGQPVALLAGMCATPGPNPTDCPAPYNYCDANNHCTTRITPGNGPIWFATAPIQPGVNAGDPTGTPTPPTGSGYIYNIMAKGYASLDDWCMSQAQQSTIPGMRNVGSWTALIIAQPDNNPASLNPALGGARLSDFTFQLSSNYPVISYSTPNGKPTPTNPLVIYDKNNAPYPNSSITGFWTGMSGAPGLAPLGPSDCSVSGVTNGSNWQVPIAGPGCPTSTNSLWGAFSNASNGSIAIIPVGFVSPNNAVAFFKPSDACYTNVVCCDSLCQEQNCDNDVALYLVHPFNGPDQGYETNYEYEARCGNAKSILCLANQS